jgi:hypothetical protein
LRDQFVDNDRDLLLNRIAKILVGGLWSHCGCAHFSPSEPRNDVCRMGRPDKRKRQMKPAQELIELAA